MSQPIERVMVYLDGSEESMTAAQYSICLSHALNAQLFGVYIVNTHALNDLVKSRIFIPSEQQEYQRDLEADADKYVRYFEEMALKKGVSAKTFKDSGKINVKLKSWLENIVSIY
jgi:hypothetical protein